MERVVSTIRGERIGSKAVRPMRTEPTSFDINAYEASITNLFVPWLVEDIPDGAWQTLQKKLCEIIRGIKSLGQRKGSL